MNFPLLKNKKLYYIFALIIVIFTASIISVYLIIFPLPDNQAPVITISQPSDEEILSGTQSILFSATDQQGFITEREILIDGVVVQIDSYSYNWNTAQYTDGSHTILCRAKDKTFWGEAEVDVIVENTEDPDGIPPEVSITQPAEGETLSGISLITFTATDQQGTITEKEILIDGYIVQTGSYSYSWNTAPEIDGAHTILCRAKDETDWGSDEINIFVNNSQVIETSPVVLKIMEFNINSSGQYSDWKEVVKEENADIIIFVETGYWDNADDEPLNQYIDEFNDYFIEENPYIGYCTQDIWYWSDGLAIMSRYPILSFNQIPEVTLDDSSSYDLSHDIIDVEVNVSGILTHLIGSHLKAFSECELQRELEQEGILNYMDSLGNVPIMYLGDFNSFSPEDWGLNTLQSGLGYGPLSMMIAPYINPETSVDYSSYASTVHTWVDVHRTLNPAEWGITNPEYDSRIDFIYVNQFFTTNLLNSTTGDTSYAILGSDHYTVDFFINLNN